MAATSSRPPHFAWRFWPQMEVGEAARAYTPRFIFGVDAPLCLALAALFFIPSVRAWSGADPWVVLAGFSVHVVVHAVILLSRSWEKLPRTSEAFSQTSNWVAAASVPLAVGANTVLAWGLFLFVAALHALGGKTVIGTLLAFMTPLVVTGLLFIGAPFEDVAAQAVLMSLIATIIHVTIAYYTDWSRDVHGEEVTRAHADAASGERTRIQADLHGTLGAALTEITLWHEVALTADPGNADSPVAKAQARARQALHQLRGVVGELGTSVHTPYELAERCRRNLAGLCEAAGVQLDVSVTSGLMKGAASLDALAAYHVEKFVQEAVTNAVRHGAPSRVVAVLAGTEEPVRVEDNGRGFDPATEVQGRGLSALGEHARGLGCRLVIDSAPGEGTCVRMVGGAA